MCQSRPARLHRQPRRREEAQLVLATLVQRVTFELVPGQTIEPEPLITLRPKRRDSGGGAATVTISREGVDADRGGATVVHSI